MVRILATCTIIRRVEALSQQIHNKGIAKVELNEKDESFLRERILTMYANPAINKMKLEKK